MKNTTPLEEDECEVLVQWMDWNKLKFTHIPSETYTKSWRQKAKNTKQGVRKGFPDYCIIIPKEKSRSNTSEILMIEMKRQKGGQTSKEQKEWIEAINDAGVGAFICKGATAAIEVLERYMK